MPYTRCAHCALLTYSAARWSSVEDCPQCGRPLPVRPSVAHELVLGSLALPRAALAALRARVKLDAEESPSKAKEET